MTEETTAGVGHNGASTELTDEQMQAMYLKALPEAERYKDKIASATADYRNWLKRQKAEWGFTKKEIEFGLELRKKEEAEMTDAERKRRRIALWLNHPIGVQADLFTDEPNREPLIERAFKEGFAAGAAGEWCKAPYDDTEVCQKWTDGWHRAQEVQRATIKPTPVEEAAAEEDDEGDGPAPDFVTKTHAERSAANDTGDEDHADAAE